MNRYKPVRAVITYLRPDAGRDIMRSAYGYLAKNILIPDLRDAAEDVYWAALGPVRRYYNNYD